MFFEYSFKIYCSMFVDVSDDENFLGWIWSRRGGFLGSEGISEM